MINSVNAVNKSRRNSMLMAVGVAVIVTLWMLSGLGSAPVDFSGEAEVTRANGERMRVRVGQISAVEAVREITISARTEPNRYVRIKAETEGTVVALDVDRGSPVAEDAPILTLDLRDRTARLAEAESLIAQRELELQARQNLRNREFASELEIAEAAARLESARAAKVRIALEIDNTSIDAPFDGIVQERSVEVGDYV
ncbi:MAG: efflux RND transporter periplasmic adaptor subunit, partial [Luteolibacter sp.]